MVNTPATSVAGIFFGKNLNRQKVSLKPLLSAHFLIFTQLSHKLDSAPDTRAVSNTHHRSLIPDYEGRGL